MSWYGDPLVGDQWERALGRRTDQRMHPEAASVKAVSGSGVVALTYEPKVGMLFSDSPPKRMAKFLAAYKYGWFYRAESVIAFDFSTIGYHVEDINDEPIEQPDLDVPFAALDPVGQLLRLLEKPNPRQTKRQLWEKHQIRKDMAGLGVLYLESPETRFGLPTGLYSISPARMWPSFSKEGELIGWVMDYESTRPGAKPVPFEPEEIILDAYASPDDDLWGVGVVEASLAQYDIQNLINRHTGDVLASGGRLSGMLWPKNRSLDEAEMQEVARSWRNVSNDPHAAKRLLIMPEPMEWTSGAATPEQIGIPELANLNRDDILAAFPMPHTVLGLPAPSGLNSGETKGYDRDFYLERTLHPRFDSFREILQVHLLSRYEAAANTTLRLVLEEEDTDNAAPRFELASKATEQPLTVDERRHILKLPPLGPTNGGNVVWLPGTLVPASQPINPEPEPVDIKAQVIDINPRRRERIVKPLESISTKRLARFLDEQKSRVVKAVTKTLEGKTKAERRGLKADDWWDPDIEDEALRAALRESIYVRMVAGSWDIAAKTLKTTPTGSQETLVDEILAKSGTRIANINETTRQAIANTLETGITRGYSITQIVDGVPNENFSGLAELKLENGGPAWDTLRAETIARTETAQAYNQAAIGTYNSFGVTEVQAIDGDQDEECAARNGKVFPIDEAYDIEDHPNGTLDWLPLQPALRALPVERLGDLGRPASPPFGFLEAIAHAFQTREEERDRKAQAETSVLTEIMGTLKALAERPIIVNQPELPAPSVTVQPTPVVMPEPRLRKIVRDKEGRIVGVEA